MYPIRVWFAMTAVWLLLLFNIERFHEPINIASFVYLIVGLTLAALFIIPQLAKVALHRQCAVVLPFLLLCKWLLGYSLLGTSLPLTVTECTAMIITLWLGNGVSRAMSQFDDSLRDLTLMQVIDRLRRVPHGQEKLYREVQRARQFGRELGIIAIKPDGKSCREHLNRFVEEMKQNLSQQFAASQVSAIVLEAVHDTDLVAIHDDHLIVAVPEATQERLMAIVGDFRQRVRHHSGLEIAAGLAMFPEEEVTLAGLLDRSTSNMRFNEENATLNGVHLAEMARGESDGTTDEWNPIAGHVPNHSSLELVVEEQA